MAKKTLTPEEYRAQSEKRAEKRSRFGKAFYKACALFLGCTILFMTTIVMVKRSEQAKCIPAGGSNVTENPNEGGNIDWNTPSEEDTTASGNEDNKQSEDKKDEKKLSTPKEQLDFFLAAFTNVKKNAKSAEKYWKNDTNYQDIAVAPIGLSGVLESLLKNNLESGDITDEKYTGEAIAQNFPPKAGAACNLKASDIKSIDLKEEGNSYIITIVVKGGVDTASGDNVGAISNVLTKDQIMEPIQNIPGVNRLGEPTCTYESATVVATVDKETGNLVDYYTTVPLILEFKNLGAKVGLQFEEKWKMEY